MLHIGRYSSLFNEIIIIILLMIFISPDTGRIITHTFLSCHAAVTSDAATVIEYTGHH